MKHFLTALLLASVLLVTGCADPYYEKLEDLEYRVAELQKTCDQINSDLLALQSLVSAIEKKDMITGVTELRSGTTLLGYRINFVDHAAVTISNGKDGNKPLVASQRDPEDGNWYWTVDGEFLLDGSGNKVRANGIDGKNGLDGVTPQIRVNSTTGLWEVSYDNGTTWTSLGVKAQGDKGDAFFQNVVVGEAEVTFTLADGTTTFTLPLMDTFKKVRDRVQSIVFIPENLDGMMTLQNGVQTTVRYRVMPEAVATALATSYASTLSFIGEEVAVTRGIASADITINNVVNEGNGRLALTVTPSGMTTGQGYAFALVMNDGTSMYSTSYTSVFYAIPPVAIGIAADGILAGKGNVNVGSTVRLIALLVPTDTNLKGVQWTSSDETVATVDANGLVTAHGNGTATITVTSTADQTVSKSIAITVSDGVITLNTDDLVSQSSAE